MADETPPKPPPDTATLRRRVWMAVGGVVGLWLVIYLTVVVTYVLGGPAGPAPTGAEPGLRAPIDPGVGGAHGPGDGHGH